MSKVNFVDTSVMTCLLDIPGKNQQYIEVKGEYNKLLDEGDSFVLTAAVLVETGNHIAHVSDGQKRRQIAEKFVNFVTSAIDRQHGWNVIPEIKPETLKIIIEGLPDGAMRGIGFGDLSIVQQFEEYWQNRQPIGYMRIWSIDAHLSRYSYTGGLSRRKDK